MDIRINDVPIDFQLERESTIEEVYTELESWLRGNGHRVLRVTIDEGECDLIDRSWGTREVGAVERLDFTVESIRQQDIDDMETIRVYLELFHRVMQSGNEEQVLSVLEELPFVIGGIKRLAPDLVDILGETLPGPIDDSAVHAARFDAELRRITAERAEALDHFFERRQRELIDPDHEMRSVCTVLDRLIDQIERVPVLLQSDGEKEALGTIGTFSQTVSVFLRLLPLVAQRHPELENGRVDGRSIEETIPEINSFLLDIELALSNNDFVLLGDLLEYEIVPRFRDLTTITKSVVENHIGSENEER